MKQTLGRPSRLLDQLSPEGRVGENTYSEFSLHNRLEKARVVLQTPWSVIN